MPLSRLGERQYYLGTFFKVTASNFTFFSCLKFLPCHICIYIRIKANWYKAAKYCRYHGMQLASIETQQENNILEEHIKSFGS